MTHEMKMKSINNIYQQISFLVDVGIFELNKLDHGLSFKRKKIEIALWARIKVKFKIIYNKLI